MFKLKLMDKFVVLKILNFWQVHSCKFMHFLQQRVPNPALYEDPPVLLTLHLFFRFFSTPLFLPAPLISPCFCCLVTLAEYVVECVILLIDMADLHLLNIDTSVTGAPCYVLYATRHEVYSTFGTDDMAFASTLI